MAFIAVSHAAHLAEYAGETQLEELIQYVRSAAHIYGLPGNTPMQQKEADEGTLMATRSAWLHQKQIETCKRRAVPEVSTL